MKGALLLSVAVLLQLTWPGDTSESSPANKQANLRRMPIRSARIKSRLHASGLAGERVVGGARPALDPSGGRDEMQGDESASPFRSSQMRTRRRPVQRDAMVEDGETPGAHSRVSRMPSSAGSPNLLASFAGKNRLLVISAPHESDGYYRLMMSLLKPDVYCELAERHVHQIVMFHQEGELGGKVRRITNEGKVMEGPLDTTLIPRLMTFLKLEKGKFGMVLLRKTLQVEERYPYPVRLEAMYEVIDRNPMRKMEKMRQKGFVQKCKGAGVEGMVVEGATGGTPMDRQPEKPFRKPFRRPTLATTTTRPTTTAAKPTTTTRRPTTTRSTTTIRPTTPTRATTTTITQRPSKAHTTAFWIPSPKTTAEPYYYNHRDRHQAKPTMSPSTPFVYYTKAFTGKYGLNRTDRKDNRQKQSGTSPTQTKPNRPRPPKKTNVNKVPNTYEDQYDVGKPTESDLEEKDVDIIPTKSRVKEKEEKKKKKQKPTKKDRNDRKSKLPKSNKKNGKKVSKNQDTEDFHKPTKRPPPPKGALETFLDYFENRRRLIVITSMSDENGMYVQQRDEYLEHVCEMAIRKVSIITIFGTLTNSTMKIDHYQLENDRPMKGLRQEDLVHQELITELRKEFGMTYNGFFMVLTDFDMKVKQFYEVPIAMKAVFDYLDTFTSRIREMEQQKRDGVMCKKEDKPRSLENFLSRFRWRRRLFVISAPNDEEWAYQQQLYGLSSQACNLGLRHISILKLLGTEPVDMGGVLELYPINGTATVEREGLSATLVRDIRNYFQISPEYFSMLLVGKDGNVKSWYPSPMWSMAIIYDLIDSMQLRRQEMAIQQSLGMRCPEDEYGGYGYPHHGYHEGYQDGYHHGYGY
ncbi:coiled-coil domain-containing protein 80 [Denticeps clupeoides]|uniref:Coiled-coil domain-containing protein 80 n=1 Tax=Denticeps clupeoides TaxID=299321 RepID=A0AAY4ATJ6_9TELE|nr:coiled-coil domain-containing protein 80 [Denticeps clupeoides]